MLWCKELSPWSSRVYSMYSGSVWSFMFHKEWQVRCVKGTRVSGTSLTVHSEDLTLSHDLVIRWVTLGKAFYYIDSSVHSVASTSFWFQLKSSFRFFRKSPLQGWLTLFCFLYPLNLSSPCTATCLVRCQHFSLNCEFQEDIDHISVIHYYVPSI